MNEEDNRFKAWLKTVAYLNELDSDGIDVSTGNLYRQRPQGGLFRIIHEKH